MTDILSDYIKHFNINIKDAEKRRLVPTEAGTRTAVKEMIGEKIIKLYHLIDKIWPDNIGYKKISDKKKQLAGVDYEVYLPDETIYVDLKSCIGTDYTMKIEDFDEVEISDDLLFRVGVPIEIYQNEIFTNTKAKLTDCMLYIICDKNGIFFINIPYSEVRHFSLKHKNQYTLDADKSTAHLKQHYPFTRYTSFNGTGMYAKKPVYAEKLW